MATAAVVVVMAEVVTEGVGLVAAMAVVSAAGIWEVEVSAVATWVAETLVVATWAVASAVIWAAASMEAVDRWVAGIWEGCQAAELEGMREAARSTTRPVPVGLP